MSNAVRLNYPHSAEHFPFESSCCHPYDFQQIEAFVLAARPTGTHQHLITNLRFVILIVEENFCRALNIFVVDGMLDQTLNFQCAGLRQRRTDHYAFSA